MASAPRLTLQIPGSTAGVRQAIDAFAAFILENRVAAEPPWQIELALDELLSNIVKYAYADRPAGDIEVTYAVADGECRVSIVDDGIPYDPSLAPRPDTESPLEIRQPGGLGVHLVRKLMDRIEYSRADGRNRVLLARRLSGAG